MLLVFISLLLLGCYIDTKLDSKYYNNEGTMALKTSLEKNKHNRNINLRSKSKHELNRKVHQLSFTETKSNNATKVMAMSCYPQYQYLPCTMAFAEWSPMIPLNPVYTIPMPVPVLVNPTPVISTSICPYVPSVVIPPTVPSVVSSNHTIPYYESLSESESPGSSFYGSDIKNVTENEDQMMYYLSLPKDLFPPARMLAIDPNALIEEFCKLPNIYRHLPWIFDLEYGIPKSPITRPIPCYNVKFNSIHCKNTPDAIHPGFESCSEEFKQVFLFYYDSIISTWYKSFVFLTCDKSVENFQTWLMYPMQELGMCWS